MTGINAGDTAFVLLCTALVCMMTPALALFYGGLVRQRDIVVVTGQYDHIQEVMDRLEIPYLKIDPEQLPSYSLANCKVLLVNCNNTYAAGFFRASNSAARWPWGPSSYCWTSRCQG